LNVLLHICCAPCAIYPIEKLRADGLKVAGFFYNPNIHPYSEYIKRKSEVEKYSKDSGLNVICGDYDLEKYFQYIVHNEASSVRCPVCWWIRLEKTAKFAKENGFDAFTTTLLASPYQDQGVIKNIGEEVARNAGIKFHYEDFRPGFKAAGEKARELGIYRQNYCGCIFSEKERIEEKKPGNRQAGKGKK